MFEEEDKKKKPDYPEKKKMHNQVKKNIFIGKQGYKGLIWPYINDSTRTQFVIFSSCFALSIPSKKKKKQL